MRALGWILLGLLSAAPSLAPVLGESMGRWVPLGASLYGLSLLPWLALAGLPLSRGSEGMGGSPLAAALFPLAAALPALAMGAGLDLAQGRLRLELDGGLVYLVGGPLLILLWRLSAIAGSRSPAATRCHGVLWGLMLPMGSAAICALRWAPPQAAQGNAWIASLNPLMWCLEFCAHDAHFGARSEQLGGLLVLLGVAGLSWGLAARLGRGSAA